MAEAGRSQQIRDGSEKETYDKLNEGKKPGDENIFPMAEVRQWYLKNGVSALKKQTGFISYVPPSNDHELQVDLFEFKYKLPERVQVTNTVTDGKVIEVGRKWARRVADVDPYGIIAINPFSNKLAIESVTGKIAKNDWIPALNKIIAKLGNPK